VRPPRLQHGSAATFDSPRSFDLVICYDVLQYLTAREAAAALRNLGRLCAACCTSVC